MPLLHCPAQHDRPHALIQLLPAVFIALLTASACSAPVPAPPTVVPTSAAPQELRVYMPLDKTLTVPSNNASARPNLPGSEGVGVGMKGG